MTSVAGRIVTSNWIAHGIGACSMSAYFVGQQRGTRKLAFGSKNYFRKFANRVSNFIQTEGLHDRRVSGMKHSLTLSVTPCRWLTEASSCRGLTRRQEQLLPEATRPAVTIPISLTTERASPPPIRVKRCGWRSGRPSIQNNKFGQVNSNV